MTRSDPLAFPDSPRPRQLHAPASDHAMHVGHNGGLSRVLWTGSGSGQPGRGEEGSPESPSPPGCTTTANVLCELGTPEQPRTGFSAWTALASEHAIVSWRPGAESSRLSPLYAPPTYSMRIPASLMSTTLAADLTVTPLRNVALKKWSAFCALCTRPSARAP